MNESGEVAFVEGDDKLVAAVDLLGSNFEGIAFVLLLLEHGVEQVAPIAFEGKFEAVLLSDFILGK